MTETAAKLGSHAIDTATPPEGPHAHLAEDGAGPRRRRWSSAASGCGGRRCTIWLRNTSAVGGGSMSRRTDRTELTEWERAADDVDRAEWALLEALDTGDAERVREAEDHLAQCQRRAGRLRRRTAG